MEQTKNGVIIDVSDSTFAQDVIQRSYDVPVVVDFWAPWCGPCRMLGPVLERLAKQANGDFVLAKLNVDNSPRVAQQFGVQGIPAVKAFRDGRVVSEFVGAQPEPQVRQFLKKVVPDEVDAWVAEARQLVKLGKADLAEDLFRKALEKNATHARALVGLGGLLLAQGKAAEAMPLLNRVPYGGPERSEAESLLARARLVGQAAANGGGDEAAYRERIAANADDLEARLELAVLLAAHAKYPQALEQWLEVVKRDRGDARNQARKKMLDVFSVLGDADPTTRSFRSQLASALF